MQEYDTYLAHMYLQSLLEQPESQKQQHTDSSGTPSASTCLQATCHFYLNTSVVYNPMLCQVITVVDVSIEQAFAVGL